MCKGLQGRNKGDKNAEHAARDLACSALTTGKIDDFASFYLSRSRYVCRVHSGNTFQVSSVSMWYSFLYSRGSQKKLLQTFLPSQEVLRERFPAFVTVGGADALSPCTGAGWSPIQPWARRSPLALLGPGPGCLSSPCAPSTTRE